jgi:CRP/FNR family transcriptional regulator
MAAPTAAFVQGAAASGTGAPAGSPISPLGGQGRLRPAGPSSGGHTSAGSSRPRQQRPTTVTYPKGQEIFSPGNGGGLVYIVRAGCVRLFKTLPDGRSINLALLGPNTIFTQEDPFDGLATGATAEALVDSTLSVVESDDLAGLIADSPELASAVVAGMTRRLTELQTLVEHLLVRDTSVRLATTLLALAARFGRPTADGMVAVTLPLTHQGLANMIGSNRVTVTRKLLEFQEEGIVRSLGRNAMAISPGGLRAHAQAAGAAGRDQD